MIHPTEKFLELKNQYSSMFENTNYVDTIEAYLAYVQCVQRFKNEELLTAILKEIKDLNVNLQKQK